MDTIAERVRLMKEGSNFRGVGIFTKMKNQQLRKLAMSMETVNYADGEDVVKIGGDGDALFIIESGACSVDMGGIAGDNMRAGMSFGEQLPVFPFISY